MRNKIKAFAGLLFALALAFHAVPSVAQSVLADFSGSVRAVIGAYSGMVAGSTITRPANTVAYSANQTICGATTVTVCSPGTVSLAAINNGRLMLRRVTLFKSGASAASSLTIWLFSAAPVVGTPTQFDATAYSGPRTADAPNYLGSAVCSNGTATSDTSPGMWYECTLAPNTNGALVAQAALGTKQVYYLISASAAYATPASLETFTPYFGGTF